MKRISPLRRLLSLLFVAGVVAMVGCAVGDENEDEGADGSEVIGKTTESLSLDGGACRTNVDCNDNWKCTSDTCSNGVCRHTYRCSAGCPC